MKTKFAIVDGQRCEAEPGLVGLCQVCGTPMISKCGELRVWHWAHKGIRHCDRWSEPETPWHRGWKNEFPTDWQEIIHRAGNGEKHIADVKTDKGRVIEFQHSPLRSEERQSREAFYGPMDWIVNGLRRTRDQFTFYKAIQGRRFVSLAHRELLRFKVPSAECALLRDWVVSRADVFFDFGVTQEDTARFGLPILWHLSPNSPSGWAILTPISRASFIESRRNGAGLKGIRVKAPERRTKIRTRGTYWHRPRARRGPQSYQQYVARKHWARSRQRF